MEVASNQPVYTLAFLQALLSAMSAAPTIAVPTSLQLFIAGPSLITPEAILTDFTAASFPGYVGVGLSPVITPVNLPSGLGQGFIVNELFTCTAPPTSPGQSILGYYLEFTGGTLAMAEIFPVPVPIVNAGDFVNLALFLPLQWSNQVS